MTRRSGARERAVDAEEQAYIQAVASGFEGNEAFGACTLCRAVVDRSAISRHVQACLRRAAGDGDDALRIHAQSVGRVVYWMHLVVRQDATLEALDEALRGLWLDEPCGHLSGFTVGKPDRWSDEWRQYVSRGFVHTVDPDPRVVPMRGVEVGDVFLPRTEVLHEYDFGTTTETTLRVVGTCAALPGRDTVRVVARNNAPVLVCGACEEGLVVSVCGICYGSDDALLCEACAREHECGVEALLPWVNSPRTGLCGYTGELRPAPKPERGGRILTRPRPRRRHS